MNAMKKFYREWLRRRANAPAQDGRIYSRHIGDGLKWVGREIGWVRETFRRAAEVEEKYARSVKKKEKE